MAVPFEIFFSFPLACPPSLIRYLVYVYKQGIKKRINEDKSKQELLYSQKHRVCNNWEIILLLDGKRK